jgi:3',5'-cyclic AMP phosphodiesterase CpdA
MLDRRKFLQRLTAAGAALALPRLAGSQPLAADSAAAPGSFDFVFFTDTHIEPELDAAHGCDMCFRKMAASNPDFAIMGGDHVYDALGVNGARAGLVFDLYKRAQQTLSMPLHNTIGNHDIFGLLSKSGVAPTDPGYGKKMYQDRMGETFYSFDHKGYHFVVLDSIQPTADRMWEARVDEEQLRWLREDLVRLPAGAPVIAVTHCPLVTAFLSYVPPDGETHNYNTLSVVNASAVLEIFAGVNVLAVLQGHTHINEVVSYKNTGYITSGAVSGNWWHGTRMGTPEGYTVVSLRDGALSTRYETYGFHSVDPREKF